MTAADVATVVGPQRPAQKGTDMNDNDWSHLTDRELRERITLTERTAGRLQAELSNSGTKLSRRKVVRSELARLTADLSAMMNLHDARANPPSPEEAAASADDARANLAGEVLGMIRSRKLAKRIGEVRLEDHNTVHVLRTMLMKLLND
jgi:hypothetical protein